MLTPKVKLRGLFLKSSQTFRGSKFIKHGNLLGKRIADWQPVFRAWGILRAFEKQAPGVVESVFIVQYTFALAASLSSFQYQCKESFRAIKREAGKSVVHAPRFVALVLLLLSPLSQSLLVPFRSSVSGKPRTWGIRHTRHSFWSYIKHLPEDSCRSSHVDLLVLCHSSSLWHSLDVFYHTFFIVPSALTTTGITSAFICHILCISNFRSLYLRFFFHFVQGDISVWWNRYVN